MSILCSILFVNVFSMIYIGENQRDSNNTKKIKKRKKKKEKRKDNK
jgi:hypothetical protein